jgi:hypothetical protein
MRSYKDVLNELESLGIHAYEGDFYDYEDLPLEAEFKMFFKFCQEYLDRDDLDFDISPARFYYNTNTTLNGLAWKCEDYYLVEIFKGSIFHLHQFFLSKEEKFTDKSLKHFKELTQQKNVTPGFFLFQIGTLYFLYHEVGHLVQRKGKDLNILEYAQEKCEGEEVPIRHVRELDADWFSAHCLAMHVKEFAESNEGNEINSEVLQEIAALCLAAIYMYFIDRSEQHPEIYYEEKCHPHPLVRLCYMAIFFLENLAANLSHEINQGIILNRSIEYSELLMKEGDKNIVKEFSKALLENLDKIENYIKQIMKNSENYPFLCVNILTRKNN